MEPEDLREKLLQCLGGPWPDPCKLRPVTRDTTPMDGYRIESLTYEVEPGDRVPALLLVPDGVDAANPAPAPSTEMTIEAPKRELDKTLYEIIVGWFTFDD